MEIKKSVDISIDEVVTLLQKLIRIDSQQRAIEDGCPFGKGAKEALDITLDYCRKLGFRTKNIDNYAGWAEVGEGKELIGIPLHLDIVPEGNGWSVDPFGGEIIDGVIYGRGAVDNKGPAAMLIHVVNNIKEEFTDLEKRIRLIFGTNEESGMECIKYYLKSGEEVPTSGFTPDAKYPLVNGEKGRLHILIKKRINTDTKRCYVKLNGGTRANMVPSECSAKIYNVKPEEIEKVKGLELENKKLAVDISGNGLVISAMGKAAHASSPENGENAISKMLAVLSALNMHIQNVKDIISIYNLVGKDYNGKALGIYAEDDIFKMSTVNLGTLYIDEKEIAVELDIRHGMNINSTGIITGIENKFGQEWEVSVLDIKDIHYVKEDAAVIKKLLKAYEEVTGEKGCCITMGGGTYASLFDNMVAFGPKFIGYRTGGHGIDERIPIAHIKTNMEIYTKAILNLLEK